jgi:uncharacterized protein (DUF4415 family)
MSTQEDKNEHDIDEDALPELTSGQLAVMLKDAEWGKYAPAKQAKKRTTHKVNLDSDVYAAFPSDKAVNDALRSLMRQSE